MCISVCLPFHLLCPNFGRQCMMWAPLARAHEYIYNCIIYVFDAWKMVGFKN